MTHVVLATSHKQPLTQSDERLRAALERRGARVTAVPWDTIPPGADGLVCLRSPWDYHVRPDEFGAWVEAWRRRPGALWNPPDTVFWNMDKIYLRSLEAAGLRIPVTHWYEPGETPDASRLLETAGAAAVVVKPRISASGYGTRLVPAGSALAPSHLEQLEGSGAIVQAFMAEIARRGELSLVFLDGRFSHAVRKRAADGDFRVQTDFGGRVTPEEVGTELRAFSERALAAAPPEWIYARVDLVETDDGPVLMEVEMIEPDLFFDTAPAAADRLADALLRQP